MKKIFLILLLISLFFSIGCSSLFGEYSIEEKKDLWERKEIILNWLEEAPFVSDGMTEVVLWKGDNYINKTEGVVSPPRGSVFLYYKDIANKSYDGFYPFTSTEVETQYVMTSTEIYNETKNSNILKKATIVGDRLNSKVFYSHIEGLNNKVALIPRTTNYNFKTGKWEGNNYEIYTQDILNTANALMSLKEVTKTTKYDYTIKNLLNTVVYFQEEISNNQDKFFKGSLYYNVYNYNNEKKYKPSYNAYPFTLTLEVYDSLTKGYVLFKENKYLTARDYYLNWVDKHINSKENWNENNIPYLGVNGNKKYIYDNNYAWKDVNYLSSEELMKMVYGLSKWKPNNANNYSRILKSTFTQKSISNWNIPTTITTKGISSLKSETTSISEGYLTMYMSLLGKDKEEKELILQLLQEQRMKGNLISKGSWSEGINSNIKDSLILIKLLFELHFEEI